MSLFMNKRPIVSKQYHRAFWLSKYCIVSILFKICRSFKLNRCWGFGGVVEHDAVDVLDFVDDAVGGGGEKLSYESKVTACITAAARYARVKLSKKRIYGTQRIEDVQSSSMFFSRASLGSKRELRRLTRRGRGIETYISAHTDRCVNEFRR